MLLPHGHSGVATQQRWLARGRAGAAAPGAGLLPRLLAAIAQPEPVGGLAALRLWGQTGERPGDWIAAADPVFLEAILAHARLHALPAEDLPLPQLRSLYEALQQHFEAPRAGAHTGPRFTAMPGCGYLLGGAPFATAPVSARLAQCGDPLTFLPQGEGARAHDELLGELQMFLYAHPLNQQRVAAGMRPINSLWIWGGGTAPARTDRRLPPLYGDEPLLRGYWHSCGATPAAWPGSFSACVEQQPRGFVAAPARCSDAQQLAGMLEELRVLLARGKLRRLTLLFDDATRVELGRWQALRFWRRTAQLQPLQEDA